MVASQDTDELRARLRDAESECSRSERQTDHLRAQLADRDAQFTELASQFNVLRRKYIYLKEQFRVTLWEYLPDNAPEFQALSVHARTGCSVVSFESDTRVDAVEIHGHLGTGRFGEVRLGFVDRPDGSEAQVALKTISKEKVRSLVALRNLANEIACMRHLTLALAAAAPNSEAAAGLNHVVTLHTASISDTNVYIAQSMGGSDLFSLMTLCSGRGAHDTGRLPVVVVAVIARGLMAGVAAIHRCGWCHRDIKPENVLIGTDAAQLLSVPSADAAAAQLHVRLCDFGVCAQLPRANAAPLSQFCGSPGFFAPELADAMRAGSFASNARELGAPDGDPNDSDEDHAMRVSGETRGERPPMARGCYDGAAADVFSAGATLLEMLLGRAQFAGLWAPMYNDYALRGRRELSRSLRRAKDAVATVLHRETVRDQEDQQQHSSATAASVMGAQQLSALALACVAVDPLERPTSDASVAATCCALSATAALARASPHARTRSFRRRYHYPTDSLEAGGGSDLLEGVEDVLTAQRGSGAPGGLKDGSGMTRHADMVGLLPGAPPPAPRTTSAARSDGMNSGGLAATGGGGAGGAPSPSSSTTSSKTVESTAMAAHPTGGSPASVFHLEKQAAAGEGTLPQLAAISLPDAAPLAHPATELGPAPAASLFAHPHGQRTC